MIYKEVNGGRYEVSGSGNLIKKITLGLSLPDDFIKNSKK